MKIEGQILQFTNFVSSHRGASIIGNVRRSQAVSICPTVPTWERDEYPPAVFQEGGQGASVRYVEPGDNQGVGGYIGKLLQSYPDGTIIEIKVVP